MKQFKQYRNGDLSEKELDDFTRTIIRAKFRKEKKNKWTQQLEKDHGVIRSQGKSTNLRRNYFGKNFMLIAASLLFLISSFFILQGKFSSQAIQFADNYLDLEENKFPNSIATKGSSDIPSLELTRATAYNKRNYLVAIEIGEQIAELEENHVNNYFFLGLSYLYSDDLPNAQKYLSQFKHINKVQFEQESRWFLALTYTKQKDFENAKSELAYIIDHQEWNFKQAEILLKNIYE